ncbi:MAG: hypothetical protein ACON4C_02270 [Henriciella sp.]
MQSTEVRRMMLRSSNRKQADTVDCNAQPKRHGSIQLLKFGFYRRVSEIMAHRCLQPLRKRELARLG